MISETTKNQAFTHIVIPPSSDTIPTSSFAFCINLQSVAFPETLISIENNAFDSCIGLEEVNFVPLVHTTTPTLGIRAFTNCDKLKRIDLTNYKIRVVEDGTFSFNRNLVEVILPPTCNVICNKAFFNCHSLTSINLENIYTIANHTFAGCVNLKYINLSNCKSIGKFAFKNCLNIEKIDFEDKDRKSKLLEICEGAFIGCSKLKEVIIPENVEYIDRHAFRFCKGLTSLYMRTTHLKEMSRQAFDGCEKLVRFDYDKYHRDYDSIINSIHIRIGELPERSSVKRERINGTLKITEVSPFNEEDESSETE